MLLTFEFDICIRPNEHLNILVDKTGGFQSCIQAFEY
jgi:hypothetical protein